MKPSRLHKDPVQDPPTFNLYADSYNDLHEKATAASGFASGYFDAYKVKAMANALNKRGEANPAPTILNFGCGIGNSDPIIRQYLPQATIKSTDISPETIRVAKNLHGHLPDLEYAVYNGDAIPFANAFDIVFVAHVFHHIPRHLHLHTLALLYGKLKPGGLLFLFEHNPFNPMTLWITYHYDYKIDPNANLLSPFYASSMLGKAGFTRQELRFTIFFPGALAALVRYEKYLAKVPFGAHYYLVTQK